MATAVPPTPDPDPTPQAQPPPAAPAVKPPNNLVGLVVLAAFLAAGFGLAHGVAIGLLTFVFVMLGWTLSVMAHEFSHAITAYVGGDHTIRERGYLAFDPRRYGDVGVSLVLPLIFLALGGIGFPGGAVYIREGFIRGPIWRAATALAGPLATFVVLLAIALVLQAWSRLGLPNALFAALAFLAYLQATALILNLLPIPGLDGFGVIRPFLPNPDARWLRQAEGLAMVAFFLLVFMNPTAGALLFGTGARIAAAAGVPPDAVVEGFRNFRFWR
jgi:Zn-dependent protease